MIKDILFGGESIEGEVGIEIEVEGKNLRPINSTYWRTDHDGSLKADEAYEYVLKKPISRDKVGKALQTINKFFEKNDSEFHPSYMAGVHVHVNVRELEVKQVVSFAVLYYIFEDILIDWCGKDRVGNHFCLRSRDAEEVLFYLEKAITSDNLLDLNTDNLRYSSLNFRALTQYGSLEFRGMRSTMDEDVLSGWVKILLALKDYAIKVKDPIAIIEDFSFKGPMGIAEELFRNTPILVKEDMIPSMYENMRQVQSIAYCKDWDKEEDIEGVFIPFEFKEKEDKVAVDAMPQPAAPLRAGDPRFIWPVFGNEAEKANYDAERVIREEHIREIIANMKPNGLR